MNSHTTKGSLDLGQRNVQEAKYGSPTGRPSMSARPSLNGRRSHSMCSRSNSIGQAASRAMESGFYSSSVQRAESMPQLPQLDSEQVEQLRRSANQMMRLKTLDEIAQARLELSARIRSSEVSDDAAHQSTAAVDVVPEATQQNTVGYVASVAQVVRVDPFPIVQRVAAFRANRLLTSLSLVVTGVAWAISLACQNAYQELRKITINCPKCRGFGIHRCPVCVGLGVHRYEIKFEHIDPCAECFGKRYLPCECCGGRYHRSIFQHRRFRFKVEEPPPSLTAKFED